MWIAAAAIGGGFVIAFIAHRKGRPFLGWWLYGAVFGVIALPHIVLARNRRDERDWSPNRYRFPAAVQPCPHCGASVHADALVCRHCRKSLVGGGPTEPSPSTDELARDDTFAWLDRSFAQMMEGDRDPPGTDAATGETVAGHNQQHDLFEKNRPMAAERRFSSRDSMAWSSSSPKTAATLRERFGPLPFYFAGGVLAVGLLIGAGLSLTGRTDRVSGHNAPAPAQGSVKPGPDTADNETRIERSRTSGIFATDPPTGPAKRAGRVPTPVAPRQLDPAAVTESRSKAGTEPPPPAPALESTTEVERPPVPKPVAAPKPETEPKAKAAVPGAAKTKPRPSGSESAPAKPAARQNGTGASPPPEAPQRRAEPAAPAVPATSPSAPSALAAADPATKPSVRSPAGNRRARDFNAVMEDVLRGLGETRNPEEKRPANEKAKDGDVSAQGAMVAIVQQRLRERGFDPGPIDSRAGASTRRAIVNFQKSVGLDPTGEIDTTLMQRLGIIGERVFMTDKKPTGAAND